MPAGITSESRPGSNRNSDRDHFGIRKLAPSTDTASPGAASASACDIAIVLRSGRQLRCREAIAETILVRLIRALEAA